MADYDRITKASKKARAIAGLAAGLTVPEVAEFSGYSERTIYRRLKDQEFMTLVRDSRREMVAQVVGRLTEASLEAVDTLRDLLNARSEQVRRGAARDLLTSTPKWIEAVDLADQVRELMEMLGISEDL